MTALGTGSYQPRSAEETGGSLPAKYLIGATVILVVVLAYLVYGLFSLQESHKILRAEVQQVVQKLQTDLEQLKTGHRTTLQNINDLRSDIDVISQKIGVAENVLKEARTTQEQLRQRQAQDVAQLQATISKKADSAQVQSQVAAIQQQSDQKFGEINKDVGAVRTDVEQTRKSIEETNRQLIDVRDTLSSQIARNKSELDLLKRKGERNYFEFAITKKQKITAVGDIKLELKKADVGKKRYDVTIYVDDQKLDKKNILANEPIQFLVGKDRLRYEIVVNSVTKDKIDGYLATPKDKALSAERAN